MIERGKEPRQTANLKAEIQHGLRRGRLTPPVKAGPVSEKKKRKTMNKAESFLEHNFHDAVLKGIQVIPGQSRRARSVVRVTLIDYDEDQVIDIRFVHAGNISFVGDFDVLRDNAGAGNTSHTKAISDTENHIKTIKKHQKAWNVGYAKGAASPIEKKLEKLEEYVTFRIAFFGATLEVLAKECLVSKRPRKR